MARSRFPEADFTPEERLNTVADILLRGVERFLADQTREKTPRRRASEDVAGPTAAQPVEGAREASPHVDEEAPCANKG